MIRRPFESSRHLRHCMLLCSNIGLLFMCYTALIMMYSVLSYQNLAERIRNLEQQQNCSKVIIKTEVMSLDFVPLSLLPTLCRNLPGECCVNVISQCTVQLNKKYTDLMITKAPFLNIYVYKIYKVYSISGRVKV